MIRNPADVLLSSLRYLKILRQDDELIDRELALHFLKARGMPVWQDMIGSWVKHIPTWVHASVSFRGIYLRYESLRKDPLSVMQSLFEQMGLAFDFDKAKIAVQASGIQNMRKLEEKEKAQRLANLFCSDLDSKTCFIGQGATGQDLKHLGEDIQNEFNEIFLPAEKAFFEAVEASSRAVLV